MEGVCGRWAAVLGLALLFFCSRCFSASNDWPQYRENPFVIALRTPPDDSGLGGVVVADVNNDGLLDYLVTKPGSVGAYDHFGKVLWLKKTDVRLAAPAESKGLPGWHGPGICAGDVDGDGRTEVLFLTGDGKVHICDGATGEEERALRPWEPEEIEHWQHLVIANFRGRGDRDLLLQACQKAPGYKMGRYLAAFAIENLDGKPLWYTDSYLGCAHNGARVADIDGDGKDEVLGGTIFDEDGSRTKMVYPKFRGHFDSIYVYDVRPDVPGLEVVLLEEGSNCVACVTKDEVLWRTDFKRQEPQNAAIGNFDPERPGLEIWCRSRYNEHQKPWTFDARGKVISTYNMDDVAPKGWTVRGVEVICAIDWEGGEKQLAAAKERHRSGDICIFDPITGRFIKRWKEHADRIYIADVSGDWREEIIVLNGSELHIYHNDAPNPNPPRPRQWTKNHYRRSKMTWNYYSP